jgi:hypothetical protein
MNWLTSGRVAVLVDGVLVVALLAVIIGRLRDT